MLFIKDKLIMSKNENLVKEYKSINLKENLINYPDKSINEIINIINTWSKSCKIEYKNFIKKNLKHILISLKLLLDDNNNSLIFNNKDMMVKIKGILTNSKISYFDKISQNQNKNIKIKENEKKSQLLKLYKKLNEIVLKIKNNVILKENDIYDIKSIKESHYISKTDFFLKNKNIIINKEIEFISNIKISFEESLNNIYELKIIYEKLKILKIDRWYLAELYKNIKENINEKLNKILTENNFYNLKNNDNFNIKDIINDNNIFQKIIIEFFNFIDNQINIIFNCYQIFIDNEEDLIISFINFFINTLRIKLEKVLNHKSNYKVNTFLLLMNEELFNDKINNIVKIIYKKSIYVWNYDLINNRELINLDKNFENLMKNIFNKDLQSKLFLDAIIKIMNNTIVFEFDKTFPNKNINNILNDFKTLMLDKFFFDFNNILFFCEELYEFYHVKIHDLLFNIINEVDIIKTNLRVSWKFFDLIDKFKFILVEILFFKKYNNMDNIKLLLENIENQKENYSEKVFKSILNHLGTIKTVNNKNIFIKYLSDNSYDILIKMFITIKDKNFALKVLILKFYCIKNKLEGYLAEDITVDLYESLLKNIDKKFVLNLV